MNDRNVDYDRCVFSIGHSNHSINHFIDLLKTFSIEVLVDSRSAPYSRYAPQYCGGMLKDHIETNGLKYLFMGDQLGGRPKEKIFYDADGHVLYSKIAESPGFQEGISRIVHGSSKFRIAILCSEENPFGCHRNLLVGRVLQRIGLHILHIRGDGRLQTDRQVELETNPKAAQTMLFDLEERHEWKSFRSVLQNGTRQTSLEQ